MDFRTFYFAKTVSERDDFASAAGTSRGLLTQVAYKNKCVELGFADVIVALSGGKVELDDLPLTENARRQRSLRGSPRRRQKQTAGLAPEGRGA
jgi:hypothetical protein